MAERPVRRVVLAAVIGLVLTVVLLGVPMAMAQLFPYTRYCGEYTGCLGYIVVAWEYGRWAALAAAWPLLRLLGVRPSWQTALLAALYAAAIWRIAEALVHLYLGGAVYLVLLSGLLAFAAAAWLTTPRISRSVLVNGVALAPALYAFATLAIGEL
ncbi:MAG: hypothetical protein HOU81_11635 [Hamadaea sp.]|nr:hypothetical protein [Hamadaea sp.]